MTINIEIKEIIKMQEEYENIIRKIKNENAVLKKMLEPKPMKPITEEEKKVYEEEYERWYFAGEEF